MKKLCMILPLALILCFLVGCQDKAAMAELEVFKAQAKVEEQNKALVLKWYEELGKGNIEKGFDADLVLMNDKLEIVQTWIDGKCCYKAERKNYVSI